MAMKSSRQPSFSIVFFDLEATGVSIIDEVTQIAAKCGSATYNKYVIPNKSIPAAMTDLTGISMTNKQMYHHGKPVDAVSPATAIATFILFLESIGGKVVLVSHRCFNSDGPMLAGLADKLGMSQRFKRIVVGFSDSLPILRKCLPGRRERGKTYRLVELAQEFLGSTSGAHDPMEDAKMLEKLILNEKIKITADDIIDSRQIVDAMIGEYKYRLEVYRIILSLEYDDKW